MGTASTRPYLDVEDAFKDSVLLVNAPPSLFGTNLSEGSWSVVNNLRLDIVRWDGNVTVAERQRRAAGNHVAVLYFFDPTEKQRSEAEDRLHPVLGHVLDTTGASTRIYACLYGASQPGMNFDPRDTIVSLAKLRGPSAGVRERVKVRHLHDEGAWLQLQTEISLVLLPRKMSKPLFNLAKDMATASDATDVLLLNSHSLLPVLAYSTTEMPIQARACRLIKPLKDALAPFLQRAGSRLRAFEVECETGIICCRAAANSEVHIVMVLPFGGAAGGGPDETMSMCGPALARVNMTHYAEHFSNVIRNTSERRNFNPILPPE